jgi:YD repeat-containing protein
MKHLIIAMLAVVVFASCKKGNDPVQKTEPPVQEFKKRLKTMSSSVNVTSNFNYNADGRILAISTNLNTVTSFIQGAAFSVKYQNLNDYYELKNTTQNAAGRIVKAERFNNNVLRSKFEYTYNPEGFLTTTKQQNISTGTVTTWEYTYQQGNLISMKSYDNGVLRYDHQFTYHTDKLNQFNLDILDLREIGYIVEGNFGRLNKNLLKSWTYTQYPTNTTYTEEYLYTTDAEGYPSKLELKTKGFTTVYNFNFQ